MVPVQGWHAKSKRSKTFFFSPHNVKYLFFNVWHAFIRQQRKGYRRIILSSAEMLRMNHMFDLLHRLGDTVCDNTTPPLSSIVHTNNSSINMEQQLMPLIPDKQRFFLCQPSASHPPLPMPQKLQNRQPVRVDGIWSASRGKQTSLTLRNVLVKDVVPIQGIKSTQLQPSLLHHIGQDDPVDRHLLLLDQGMGLSILTSNSILATAGLYTLRPTKASPSLCVAPAHPPSHIPRNSGGKRRYGMSPKTILTYVEMVKHKTLKEGNQPAGLRFLWAMG